MQLYDRSGTDSARLIIQQDDEGDIFHGGISSKSGRIGGYKQNVQVRT